MRRSPEGCDAWMNEDVIEIAVVDDCLDPGSLQ